MSTEAKVTLPDYQKWVDAILYKVKHTPQAALRLELVAMMEHIERVGYSAGYDVGQYDAEQTFYGE